MIDHCNSTRPGSRRQADPRRAALNKPPSTLRTLVIAALVLSAAACRPSLIGLFPATPTPTATPGTLLEVPQPQAATPITPLATVVRSTSQPAPTAPVTPTPDAAWLTGEVRVYPGPLHYSGDLLTVEVAVENIHKLEDLSAVILNVDDEPSPLNVQPFVDESPLRSDVLVFRWAWDTHGLTGLHQLSVTLPAVPGKAAQRLITHINLLAASDRPPQEFDAKWDVRDTTCCRIRFITHTAAQRDIIDLADRSSRAVFAVERKVGFPVSGGLVPLTFIGTVWGNGAFTRNEVVVSYVDRDFTATDLDTILKHEVTHWAFRKMGQRTPLLLAEGAAVYVAGGHYKPEPLPERGAAVLDLGDYVPLPDLADQFNTYEHEVAYIEAGSFVQYLTETYGWGKFLGLYSSEKVEGSGAKWLDQALTQQYQVGLRRVEQDYKVWLGQHPAGSQTDDVRLSIALFTTIRRYQDQYAPYQESLPNSQDAININDVSDFMRQPTAPENIALETALQSAGDDLRTGRYAAVDALLKAVNGVLDTGNFTAKPISDYLAIATALGQAGYEGQRIDLTGDTATVGAIRDWPRLVTLQVTRGSNGWQINTGK